MNRETSAMRKLFFFCSFVAAAAFSTTLSRAATISVNFEGNNNAGAPTALNPTDSAGVAPFTAANWNNFSGNTGTSGVLNDSSNVATPVTITVVGQALFGSGTGTASADRKLLNGYVDSNTGTNTWTFQNVPAGLYTLISYALPDNLDGRISEYSVNGGTAYNLLSDGGANFVANGFVRATGTGSTYTSGNYVQFDNVSPIAGNITLTGTGVFRNYSNGIQLVAVPEPASILAIGVGGLGMMLIALRRRR